MKVQLRLKKWKYDNTKPNWDIVISYVPPYYRTGVSHENLNKAFVNGGVFVIDFNNADDVAKDFMKNLVALAPNVFDIGTAP
jgi:hypothetical protein